MATYEELYGKERAKELRAKVGRKKFNKQQIIKDMQKAHQKYGSFPRKDIGKYTQYNPYTLRRYFGSLPNLAKEAGFKFGGRRK